jgi:uncharacterized protein
MSKQIAIIFNMGKRVVIGVANQDECGFRVTPVADDESIVVMCDGPFSWSVVKTDRVTETTEVDQLPSQSSATHRKSAE